jgi:hypothetical protein
MQKILLSLILSFAISASLAGCAGMIKKSFGPNRVVTDTYCSVASPMRCSRRDTPETLAQCKKHNFKLCKLCPQTPGCPK